MGKLRYTFKTDTLFKMLFVKHRDLLKHLVAALLDIALESIEQFDVRNPEMPPQIMGDKFCRLDINMIVNSQRIDLEIQIVNQGYYAERVMLYWAREFSTALPAGQGYDLLPRTIIISIIDFNMFDCEDYHSFFQLLEVKRHTLLSDKMGFHFFELKKVPEDVSDKNDLLLWLSLFRAETAEDLERIKGMGVPEMNQAINAYYSITASPEFHEIERMREKARHDEAQALHTAEQKGIQKGIQKGMRQEKIGIARNLIKIGMPPQQISAATGLTQGEVEALYATP